MKFSLRTLGWTVLFAALFVNALLITAKCRKSTANTAQLGLAIAGTEERLVFQESTAAGIKEMDGLVLLLESSKRRFLAAYESIVDSKFKVVPVDSKLSIVGRPEFQRFYSRTFLINVPQEFNVGLKVEFENSPPMSSVDGGKFESTDEAVIPLPNGVVDVEFSFAAVEALDAQPVFKTSCADIRFDNRVVFSRVYRQAGSTGHSGSVQNYEMQRNFSIDEKLPKLLRFQPSDSDVSIRLSLVRLKGEE